MKFLLSILFCPLLACGSINNWTNSQTTGYSAGDTNILYGTWTTALNITNGGTSGNPITFLFASNANFTAPCWTNGAVIDLKGNDYITIDGGVNGLIQNTASGSLLTYRTNFSTTAITGNRLDASRCGTDITIRNLTISNLYVKVPVAGITESNLFSITVGMTFEAYDVKNINIISNRIYHCANAIVVDFARCTNLNIIGNTINKISVGAFVNGQNTGYSSGFVISDNTITDFSPYSGAWTVLAHPHNDGLHFNYGNFSATNYGMRIERNYIGGDISEFYTSSIKVTPDAPCFQGMQIVNNILIATNGAGNGSISTSYLGQNEILIANNTIVVRSPCTQSSAIQVSWTNKAVIFNNYISGFQFNISDQDTYGLGYHHSIFQSDYNALSVIESTAFTVTNDMQISYGAWTNLGYDAHSMTNTPTVNASYQPTTGDTVLIGNGTNLFAHGITNDFAGTVRPSTGAWTIGAFESGSEPPPEPPTTGTFRGVIWRN